MVGVSPSKVLAPFRASPVPFRFVVSRLSFALGRLSFFSFPLLLRRSSLFSPFTLSRTTHTHTQRGISVDSFAHVYYFLRPLAFFHPASLSPDSRRISYPRFPVDPLHRSNDRIFDEANRERLQATRYREKFPVQP